jgi:ATP-dependent Clp protease adaptor protein ClpS
MSIAPVEQEVTSAGTDVEFDVPWITLVWNDPVNLMSYVTYVFQSYFGYSREKAESLMLDVHTKGKAVVATGPREKMEIHTEALHGLRAVGDLPEGRLMARAFARPRSRATRLRYTARLDQPTTRGPRAELLRAGAAPDRAGRARHYSQNRRGDEFDAIVAGLGADFGAVPTVPDSPAGLGGRGLPGASRATQPSTGSSRPATGPTPRRRRSSVD